MKNSMGNDFLLSEEKIETQKINFKGGISYGIPSLKTIKRTGKIAPTRHDGDGMTYKCFIKFDRFVVVRKNVFLPWRLGWKRGRWKMEV